MERTFKNLSSKFQNALKWISVYVNHTIFEYVQNNDILLSNEGFMLKNAFKLNSRQFNNEVFMSSKGFITMCT